MCRILWIEDEADGQMADYVDPVIDAEYDLDVEVNATDAIRRLKEDEYDLVIFDLIINAGDDVAWNEYDQREHHNKSSGYLGLQLMRAVLSPEKHPLAVRPRIGWLTRDKIAVFSVVTDKEVITELRGLGISRIESKTEAPITAVLDIIHAHLGPKTG